MELILLTGFIVPVQIVTTGDYNATGNKPTLYLTRALTKSPTPGTGVQTKGDSASHALARGRSSHKDLRLQVKSQSYVTTGGQLVILAWCQPMTKLLLLSDSNGFLFSGVSFLTRGRVYSLQFLLSLYSAVILVFESRETHDNTLLYQFKDTPTWRARLPLTISHRKRAPQLYPQALAPFSSPLTTRRDAVEVF
jgi:hypothetical protein